jgi:AraC-like DNA-binding protein
VKNTDSSFNETAGAVSPNYFSFSPQLQMAGWQTHNSGLLGYLEEGLLELRTGNECRIFSAGATIYIPPKTPHIKRAACHRATGWFFGLPDKACDGLPDHISLFRPSDLLLAMLKRLASFGDADENHERLLLAMGDEIKLLQPISQVNIPFPQHPGLAGIATQIMENPSDMKNIDYWARQAGMSRRSFTKHFKDQTGLTFSIWRQRVKLIAALKLIGSGKNNTDLALSVGYKNASTFNTVFSKQFGIPPRKYVRLENSKHRYLLESRDDFSKNRSS